MGKPPLRRRGRLLWRITLRVMPVALVVVLFTQVVIGWLNYRGHRDDLRTRAELHAKLQADALSLPMWNMDNVQIDRMIRALDQDPDFMSVRIVFAKGDQPPVEFNQPREAGNDPVTATNVIYFNDGVSDKPLGELSVTLSSRSIDKALMNQVWVVLAAVTVLTLGYILSMLWALNNTVFRPVHMLLSGMADVGRHRWVTVQWPARDEIGELVGAFNHMVAGLRAGEDARQALREREERYAMALADEARAEAANRAKSEFLANMSHELRTPLNAIGNYCMLLKEELVDLGHSSLLSDLENIEAANKHLLAIINDVLDLSKIEAGHMEMLIEEFDIGTFVRDIKGMALPLAVRNRNTFVVEMRDDLGSLHSDVTRVRQSLLNLISNAMKFTSEGTVTLKVDADDATVTFSVLDTGIGMTDNQVTRLFEPFVQADASTTKRFGGTGLGLALTRTFVTMLGGRVGVVSQLNKGSTFTITLPRRQARGEPASQETPGRILIIARAEGPLGHVSATLEADGHRVIWVDGVDAAERSVVNRRPDLIVADLGNDLAESNRLLEALKRNPALRDLPVIALEFNPETQLGTVVSNLDYLCRPVAPEVLVETVRRYLTAAPIGTVLVVDDEKASRSFLARTVESLGLNVVEASEGRAALELLDAIRPDLILLDLVMPVLDGFGFLREMRAKPQNVPVPVIVVTSKDLSRDDIEFLMQTCDQIVLKGNFTREQLVDNIRYWLAKAQARRSMQIA